MAKRAYYVVDAFTAQPFAGNAAAVVLDCEGLDDADMQAIAAEFNLSETTFVLPPSTLDPSGNTGEAAHEVRFRWFTPGMEVDMCGHATIAGVRALAESGRLRTPADGESVRVRIETRSGWLTAFLERLPGDEAGWMIWLDLIDPRLHEHPLERARLAEVLRLPVDAFECSISACKKALPVVETQDRDVLVFVKDTQALGDARPDFAALGDWMRKERLRGMSLATTKTLTPSIHVQSRFFAPAAGIDEDPVTGSVHGPLAAYVVQQGFVPIHGDLAGLTCVQSKAGGRAGLINALVQQQGVNEYAVRIGGRTFVSMVGSLHDK